MTPSSARRVRVVLQSRLSSSRLPAKAMLTLAGRPMVVLAAQRAGSTGADVVVATSDRPEDDTIAVAVTRAGLQAVRGPLDDPLRRFVLATEDLSEDDVVVRLTADNVVPDGELVDLLAADVLAGAAYSRLGGDDPALPYGVAGEAFLVSSLREADRSATQAHEREHVTPRIRRVSGDRRVHVPRVPPEWAGLRCTIDTYDDYVLMSRLLADVSTDPGTCSWRELCDLVAARAPRTTRLAPRTANPIDQGPLVLGTVQLGLPYGAANALGRPEREVAEDVLRAAVECGVSHVDSARAYGDSEQRIGSALRQGLSEHVRVVTKVRPLDDVPFDAPAGWGREAVAASTQTSLRMLGRSSIDALLLHRAADWERPGVRSSVLELRDSGVARLVGASVSAPEELTTLLADPEVGYVQLPFNMLDRRWLGDATQEALAARPDVVVTCRSTYLQGLLVSPAARWPEGHDPGPVTQAVAALVDELDRKSAADLCLGYVLGHSWVTSVVVGAETAEQVRGTAGLVQCPPLTPAEISRVHEVLKPGSAELVDPARWRSP